jgi:hypothetical protein
VARIKETGGHSAAVSLGIQPTVDHGLPQMFSGAALSEQGDEVAQFALFKPRILVLDYANNVIQWNICELLGKATLHSIDLRPLFLRHAVTLSIELTCDPPVRRKQTVNFLVASC